MRTKYLPLLVLIFLGSLNEVASYFIIVDGRRSNMINGNIYVLFDFALTVWIFSKLGSLSKKFLYAILVTGILVWVTDDLVVNSLRSNNSLFRMVSSFLVVFLSIDKIIQVMFDNEYAERANTDLMLSYGFLAFFAYKAFVEAFHLFPMHLDKSFYIILWVILAIINIIVNLLFTVAILCIQTKKPSSIHLLPA